MFSFRKGGEAQTTAMLNEAITNDACYNSVCCYAEPKENSDANVSCPICNEKCSVSLIEKHVDICLRRENNEFRVIPDIIISDDENDDKHVHKHGFKYDVFISFLDLITALNVSHTT